MKPGTKPKPTRLKVLQGNPSGRPLNANEPKPPVEIPDCPSHLDAVAQRHWNQLAPRLAAIGLLTNIDADALAAYCQAYARWVKAERELEKFRKQCTKSGIQGSGMIIKTGGGYPMINPLLSISNKAVEEMRKWAAEFGMTPSSRSRVSVTGEDIEDAERWLYGPQ